MTGKKVVIKSLTTMGYGYTISNWHNPIKNTRKTRKYYSKTGVRTWQAHKREIPHSKIGLLGVCATRPLDDNIWCITSCFYTICNCFFLHQLCKESSNKCIPYKSLNTNYVISCVFLICLPTKSTIEQGVYMINH